MAVSLRLPFTLVVKQLHPPAPITVMLVLEATPSGPLTPSFVPSASIPPLLLEMLPPKSSSSDLTVFLLASKIGS
ncbi:hypothetical protein BDZ94DRAFT_1263915 [Collybia nuda]|uniref:Uncharacterized protein n=1 Tax=Collybia nuda TaxID=64659 RepID=A0A9P6CD43_9AGAR|nr:hypothetical protein BDZ94DRAFT_1263915 [Collybia nuda]